MRQPVNIETFKPQIFKVDRAAGAEADAAGKFVRRSISKLTRFGKPLAKKGEVCGIHNARDVRRIYWLQVCLTRPEAS